MAPSNEKEANSAGEQNAEGEDGAVGGARSQVTGSRPPRLGSTVAPEAFHTEGSVFRQCCLHALGDSENVWQAHIGDGVPPGAVRAWSGLFRDDSWR